MDAQELKAVLAEMRATGLNLTSGKFLHARGMDYLPGLVEDEGLLQVEAAGTVLTDLRIKQRACATINKAAWWASLLTFLAALTWRPLGATVQGPYDVVLTAVAGGLLALHTTYKKRQTALEGVMRALFVRQGLADWIRGANETTAKIDLGTRLEDLKQKQDEPDKDGNKNNDAEESEA